MSDSLERAMVLLKAAHDLITKADNSPFVEDVTSMTVYYDGADCDGSCLRDDIENWFEGDMNEPL